jgi:hypothetical protein
MFQTTNQILTIGVFAFLDGCSHFFLIRIWLESLKIEWLKSKKKDHPICVPVSNFVPI